MKKQTTVLTSWPEAIILDEFYVRVRAGVDRLELLREMADIELERPSDWDMSAVRAAMAGVRVTLTAEGCFACRTRDRKFYWHHIIQVQHGGSSTPGNLVALCKRCHRSVHPWLDEPTTTENRRGWTWIGDFVREAGAKILARLR